MNLESMLRRFEQQLTAFEKLHADELKGFEEKLATYMRLHADEVKFLREELAELRKELAAREEESGLTSSTVRSQSQARPPADHAVEPAARLNRRDFLSGSASRRQT